MRRSKRNCFPCKSSSFTYSYMRFPKPCCTVTHLIIAVCESCAPAHLLVVFVFIMCDGGDCRVAITNTHNVLHSRLQRKHPRPNEPHNCSNNVKISSDINLNIRGQAGVITSLFRHFCLTQVLCSHTPPTLAATTWTSPMPCRPVWNKVPWLQATISCITPGETAWTGATLAGWVTARWSIPLSTPGGRAAAPATGPASEATAVKPARASMMCSALHLPWKVGLVIQHPVFIYASIFRRVPLLLIRRSLCFQGVFTGWLSPRGWHLRRLCRRAWMTAPKLPRWATFSLRGSSRTSTVATPAGWLMEASATRSPGPAKTAAPLRLRCALLNFPTKWKSLTVFTASKPSSNGLLQWGIFHHQRAATVTTNIPVAKHTRLDFKWHQPL